MTQPELEIVWDGGSLDLLGENDTPYGPVTIQAVAEGTEWGNPQSVRRALLSALADGSASALERHDNRTVTVKLRLTAADSAALAGGEAPLHMLSTMRRPELRWTPPNDFAAPAVYIVVGSDLAHVMDDLDENRCRRTYSLTLTCLPFARSIDPMVIEALPPFVAAPTVLDDCTSTTGWASSTGSVSFAVVSGAVEVDITAGAVRPHPITLTKTIPRTKRYLALETEDVGRTFLRSNLTVVTASGPQTPPLVGVEGRWSFYDLPAALGSIASMTLQIQTSPLAYSDGVDVRILSIAESDVPAVSAGRQSLRVISTPGSARADGSLLVESRDADTDGSGTPLGEVIVYTGPQYDPRLSPGRVDAVTADPLALSGARDSGDAVSVTSTFVRRASEIPPGSYSVWVRAKGDAADSVNWTVAVKFMPAGSLWSVTAASLPSLGATTTFAGTDYNLFHLGNMDLPGLNVDPESALDAAFRVTGVGDFVSIDEVLIFNRTLGRLTVIDTRARDSLLEVAGDWTIVTDGGATRVWLDAATLGSNERLMAGSPSRELATPVSMLDELRSYDGAHLFTPDATFVYVGTTGTLDPVVTGEFRPAWHTHPAV